MEHLGVLLLIPLTRVSPSQGYPGQQHANSSTHLHTRTEHADLQTGLFFVCSTVFSRPADHLPEMSAVSMQLVCIKCAVRFYLVTER